MVREWDILPNDLQLTLAQRALSRAAATLAVQAEVLAEEIDRGHLSDRGGAEALRLFAAVVRMNSEEDLPTAGAA